MELLNSIWASHQHAAALILTDAFYGDQSLPFPPLPDVIRERLELIVGIEVPPPFGEVDSLIISSLRSDAKVLSQVKLYYLFFIILTYSQSLLSLGLGVDDLAFFNEEESNMETCGQLATVIYENCLMKLKPRMTPQILDQLEARRKRLLVTIGYLQVELVVFFKQILTLYQTHHAQLHISNQGAAAGALVSANSIPTKLTPVVRSLMNSVRVNILGPIIALPL